MTWRPLSERNRPDSDHEALHEGMPRWLRQTLLDWTERRLQEPRDGQFLWIDDSLKTVERALRIGLDWESGGAQGAWSDLRVRMDANHELALDVVDLLVIHADPGQAERLTRALEEAGSAWQLVGIQGHRRLERRVPEEVVVAFEAAQGAAGPRAREHLRLAWTKAYGRSPDSSGSYRESVRAVEAAAKPIVEPNHATATLGTMIRLMQATPAKWSVALEPSDGDAVGRLVAMMQLLWTSQLDRHGTDDETQPLNVSDDQAAAAVHLAAVLVQWFSAEAVGTV